MNKCLIREQKAHAVRQRAARREIALALLVYVVERWALLRLAVAMIYRRNNRWPYLTRWISVYKTAERIWKDALRQIADKAEAEWQLEQDRREGLRLGRIMAHEGRQAQRRLNGRSPAYLRRQDRRFFAQVAR